MADVDVSSIEKVRDFLKRIPPQSEDQKVFGSVVLAYLESREAELRSLRRTVAKLARIVVALTQGEEDTPAMPGGNAEGDGEDLTPNVAGSGAVNPQPIMSQAPPMPSQKNGSTPPVAGPIVTPNAPSAVK